MPSHDHDEDEANHHDNDNYFEAPFVPLLPCLSIALNWYLIAQLEFLGLFLLLLYLSSALLLYRLLCKDHVYERVCETPGRLPEGLGSPIGIGLGPVVRRSASSASEELNNFS